MILCGYLRKAQGREARPLLLRVLISSLARLPKRSTHIEIIDKALKNRLLQEGTGVVSMHSVIEWIEKEVVVHKGGKHGGLFSCSDDEKLCCEVFLRTRRTFLRLSKAFDGKRDE